MICTAWKNPIDGASKEKTQAFVNDYKRELLEALIREGVKSWDQVEKGLTSIADPWLPVPTAFAKQCRGGNEITGAWGTGAHKIWRKDRLLEDADAKARAEEAGKAELGKLKELF